MKQWKISSVDIVKLLRAQEDLNIKYTGKAWRKVVSKDKIASAIKTEFSEYLEVITSKWKWWKIRPDGTDETILLEIVDVLHFLLTSILKERGFRGALKEFNKIGSNRVGDLTLYPDTFSFKSSLLTKTLIKESAYSEILLKGKFKGLNTKTAPMVLQAFDLIYFMCSLVDIDPKKTIDFYFKKNQFNQERIVAGYKHKDVAIKETEIERVGSD